MITLDDLAYLTSPDGESLLELLSSVDLSDQNILPLLTKLRKTHTIEHARGALTMARLRKRAEDKFGAMAARMYFSDDGLQQASHPLVRNYRAEKVGAESVLDVCCGIGSDSIAFAQNSAQVVGLDLDPIRVEMARLNAKVLDLDIRFEVADVRDRLPNEGETIFFDPARRDGEGRRIFNVEGYIPPLSLIREWRMARIVVKLSPGVNHNQLTAYGGCLEFISVAGELKEAVLWFGAGATTTMATLLVDAERHHWHRESAPTDVMISEPRHWLIEPDPALIRAGLVQEAADHFGGHMLDNTIAYFTSDTAPDSPWVRAWRVIDWMPFHLKRLRAYLCERGFGRVTVKKRGSPITPEGLAAKLKLKGNRSCTLVLTRREGQPIVLICEDRAP